MSDNRALFTCPLAKCWARFCDKSLSPVELLGALIKRAESIEPTIKRVC